MLPPPGKESRISPLLALFGLHFANNGLMDDEKSEATVLGRKPADFLR